MELEEAIKHWKNNLDKWKKDRPDLPNTEIVEEIDYDYKVIEIVLNHITKQEKMIELMAYEIDRLDDGSVTYSGHENFIENIN